MISNSSNQVLSYSYDVDKLQHIVCGKMPEQKSNNELISKNVKSFLSISAVTAFVCSISLATLQFGFGQANNFVAICLLGVFLLSLRFFVNKHGWKVNRLLVYAFALASYTTILEFGFASVGYALLLISMFLASTINHSKIILVDLAVIASISILISIAHYFQLIEMDQDTLVERVSQNHLYLMFGIFCTYCAVIFYSFSQNYISALRLITISDPLTGLLNRRYFVQYQMSHKREACAVYVIDVDHFKSVNDTYGHDIGDKLLIKIAGKLKNSTIEIPHAKIGRLGGEEFIVTVPWSGKLNALEFAKKLLEQCADAKVNFANEQISRTVSIGVTKWLKGDEFYHSLDNADKGLYCAKINGRNRYAYEADDA